MNGIGHPINYLSIVVTPYYERTCVENLVYYNTDRRKVNPHNELGPRPRPLALSPLITTTYVIYIE